MEEGSGPLVLLVHGFPESWYSWRHQLPVIAEAGFRAVAIDVRGYGRSSAPLEVEAYGMLQHVSDNLGVVEALACQGSPVMHHRPRPGGADRRLLGPPATGHLHRGSDAQRPLPPSGRPGGPRAGRPTEAFAELGRQAGQDEEFYISYFQEPGRAEREAEIDVRSWLLGFYVAASADGMSSASGAGTIAFVARGKMLRDHFPAPGPLPGWLTEDDLGFYAGEFERTGFRRSAQPLPQRGPGLAGPPAVERRAYPGSIPVHRRGEGRPDHMGGQRHRPLSGHPAGPAGQPHPAPVRSTGSSRSGPMRSTGSSWTG